jgi:hypothetical protein
MSSSTIARACGLVVLSCASASAATIEVPAGGNLQSALDRARPGDTITLPPNATFVGNFVLPRKDGDAVITLRTVETPGQPSAAERVQPEHAALLAKLRSGNDRPALATAPGAHHWRLELLEFQANAGGFGDIITLGDGSTAQNSLAQVPHDLAVDRCYVHGDVAVGQKRGIALNSASTSITRSYLAEMKAIGQDSQAIMAWNGPGPYTISDNYLEAAGENLLFGGADPSIPNLVPSDATITGNTLSHPLAWRGDKWQVKNLLELKNARRITISGNLLEYNWPAAQSGWAVLFTVRNQDGRCPWCTVDHVVFERNIVRHSAMGVSILGVDNNQPSAQTQSIVIRNNLFFDIDNEHWGGNGYFLLITGGPRDIVIDHNTIIQDHAYGIAQVEGPPVLGFEFTNNVVRHNAYGIIGASRSPGLDTISAFFPASNIEGNVIADGDASRYPRRNRFPSSAEFRAEFVSYDTGDYRLKPTSSWRSAGTDGLPLGADLTNLPHVPDRPPRRPEPPRRPQPAAANVGGRAACREAAISMGIDSMPFGATSHVDR